MSKTKAAAYDEDHRQTEEDYAASHSLNLQDLKDSIAATGVVECPSRRSTAQLTVSSDVITTAAHAFLDNDTCRLVSRISSCTFDYTWKAKLYSIPIAATFFKTNLTCPFDSNRANDWAVVKLVHPATGPAPYKIDDIKTLGSHAGDKLLVVEGLSADFCVKGLKTGLCLPDRRKGGFLMARTVQDCTLRSTEHPEGRLFLTDCAGSHGASGSGILSQDDHTLLDIRYTDSSTDAESRKEYATGHPIIQPYDRQDWSAAEVPVAGDFAEAIMEATGGQKRRLVPQKSQER